MRDKGEILRASVFKRRDVANLAVAVAFEYDGRSTGGTGSLEQGCQVSYRHDPGDLHQF